MAHPSTLIDSPPLQPPFQLLLSTQIVWTITSGYNSSLLRTAGSSDAIVFILFQESLGFCVDFDRSPPSEIDSLLLPISQVLTEQQPSLSSAHRASFRTLKSPSARIRNRLFYVLSASCIPLRVGPCMSQVGSSNCRCDSISYPRIRLSELPG